MGWERKWRVSGNGNTNKNFEVENIKNRRRTRDTLDETKGEESKINRKGNDVVGWSRWKGGKEDKRADGVTVQGEGMIDKVK